MIYASTKPLWTQVGELHDLWVNSRPADQSIALSIFFEHLAQALHVGLAEVEIRRDVPAVLAGDKAFVCEWRLSGDLDALRAALKAAHVDVHPTSLDNPMETEQ